MPEPLSTTRAAASSSHILIQFWDLRLESNSVNGQCGSELLRMNLQPFIHFLEVTSHGLSFFPFVTWYSYFFFFLLSFLILRETQTLCRLSFLLLSDTHTLLLLSFFKLCGTHIFFLFFFSSVVWYSYFLSYHALSFFFSSVMCVIHLQYFYFCFSFL